MSHSCLPVRTAHVVHWTEAEPRSSVAATQLWTHLSQCVIHHHHQKCSDIILILIFSQLPTHDDILLM